MNFSKKTLISVTAVIACIAVLDSSLSGSVFAAPTDGSLDTAFGNALFPGRTGTNVGAPNSADYAYSMAVQSDGKILVAGVTGNDFAVLRYKTDGSLDTSFDTDGKAITDIGTNTIDDARGIALQSDGKILVAGTTTTGSTSDFVVVRYNTDGILDPTFGTDGKTVTDISTNSVDNAHSMALQADGKILVAGSAILEVVPDFAVVRYNTNGSLDPTFDTDGKVITNINDVDEAYSVAVQADNKIIVAGYSAGDFGVVRYNTNGSLDPTFGTDGKAVTVINANSVDNAYSMVLQADGKILVAGKTATVSDIGTTSDFVVVRYNTNGSLDPTFDTDGKVITNINDVDEAYSVALQADNKIMVAGNTKSTGRNKDFAVMRYSPNGSLDSTFDGDGITTTDGVQNSDDDAHAIAVQSDDKILIAGSTNFGSSYDFALVRYNATRNIVATSPTTTVISTTTTIPATTTTVISTTTIPATTTTVVKKKSAPVVSISKPITAKSIAIYLNLAVSSTSQLSISVSSVSAKYCTVSGTKLKALKAGSCKVTIKVIPKKGKTVSKTVTLKTTK